MKGSSYLIENVFLPKKLPQKKYSEVGELSGRKRLFSNVIRTINVLIEDHLVDEITNDTALLKILDFVEKYQLLHQSNLSVCSNDVLSQMRDLGDGEMVGVFVEKQNVALLFERDDLFCLLTVFYISARSDLVLANVKLTADFPMYSIKVPFDRVRNPQFVEILCDLANYEFSEAMTKSRKGNINHTEIREVTSPKYIVEYLLSSLAGSCGSVEVNCVKKVIRDQVLWKDALEPWRRSPLYLSLKYMLHFIFVHTLGVDIGTLCYKLLILQFQMKVFRESKFNLEVDDTFHIIRKISLRIKKIDPSRVEHMIDDIFEEIESTVKRFQTLWNRIDYRSREVLDFRFVEDDTICLFPNSEPMRKDLFGKHRALENKTIPTQICSTPRIKGSDILASFKNASVSTLYDIEFAIKQYWYSDTSETPKTLFSILRRYSRQAMTFYLGNPLGKSQMLLIHYIIIALIDKRNTKLYPLLLKYQTGIQNPKNFSTLLLNRDDVQLLNEIEGYIRIRSEHSTYESCIIDSNITSESFSVNFAKNNVDMRNTRVQINQETQKKIQEKKEEYKRIKKDIESELARAMKLSHEIYQYRGQSKHSTQCSRCRLERSAKERSLSVFEKLLPSNDLNWAVIYELDTPEDLIFLQEAIALLFSLNDDSDQITVRGWWSEYSGLCEWSMRRGTERKVRLGNTEKTIYQTHYKSKLVYSSSESDFVTDNNGLFHLFYGNAATTGTFMILDKILSTLKFAIRDRAYHSLQPFLSTGHTENDVIAVLSECSQEIHLNEFKEFGRIRAGNHLTYRNLLCALELDSLSFEKESVLNLLYHSILESGQYCETNYFRVNRWDLTQEGFCTVLLEKIERMISLYRENWQNYNLMHCLAIILIEVISYQDRSDIEYGLSVLRQSRDVLSEWISALIEVLSTSEQPQEIRKYLIDISGILTITFNIEKNFVINDPDDIQCWLFCRATLKENLLLYHMDDSRRKLLVWQADRIALDTEDYLHQFIENEHLQTFVKNHWSEWKTGQMSVWSRLDTPQDRWYQCKFSSKKVGHVVLSVNIYNGDFLIGGLNSGCLPDVIINDVDFKSFFRNSKFEVSPGQPGSFVTKFIFHGVRYIFTSIRNGLRMQSRDEETGEILEFVPSSHFKEDLPKILVDQYSYWFDNQTKKIVLKNKTFDFKGGPSKIYYTIDLSSNIVEDNMDRRLFDVHSNTFKDLTQPFLLIEDISYIHLFLDGMTLVVDLPRMHLKFNLEGQYFISIEYEHYRVSHDQEIGTLRGLNRGLILEFLSEKKILIPHGDVRKNLRRGDFTHPEISIDLNSLKEPPYFEYKLNFEIQQLMGTKAHLSWCYLAYLHAVTSSVLPDPFLGITGVEQSILLLKTRCWSSEPLGSASLNVLMLISELSPVRNFYPAHLKKMESIEWPTELLSYTSYEGFVFLIQEIIRDSYKLEFLFEETPKRPNGVSKLEKDILELSQREYHYDNCKNSLLEVECVPVSSLVYDTQLFNLEFNETIRINSEMMSSRHWKGCSFRENCLQSLLLKKTINFDLNDIPGTIYEWKDIDFNSSWISFYEFALKSYNLNYLLNFFVHREVNSVLVDSLFAVALNPHLFRRIHLQSNRSMMTFTKTDFNIERLKEIIKQYANLSYNDSDYHRIYQEEKKKIVASVKAQWPTNKWKMPNWSLRIFDKYGLKSNVDSFLTEVYQNRMILTFFKSLDQILATIQRPQDYIYISSLDLDALEPVRKCCPKKRTNFEFNTKSAILLPDELTFDETELYTFDTHKEKPKHFPFSIYPKKILNSETHTISRDYFRKLEESWNIHFNEERKKIKLSENLKFQLEENVNIAKERIDLLLQRLEQSTSMPQSLGDQCLLECRMVIGFIPSVTLPLIQHENNFSESYTEALFLLLETWGYYRRYQRCLLFLETQNLSKLEKELMHKPHANWDPRKFPSWMLFELQQDILIRDIQYTIALHFINAESSIVTQLNMGEGKTFVINPMLLLYLSDGNKIARLTVLNSLFKTNSKQLNYQLGGLIARRIYNIPCQRSASLDVQVLQNTYRNCLDSKGVIITVPENRNSFELKVIEAFHKGSSTAGQLQRLKKWKEEHIIDVLDESDEILGVKYQLIYTLGAQMQISGGHLRWKTIQVILKLVQKFMRENYNRVKKNGVDIQLLDTDSSHWTSMLFVHRDLYQELKEYIAESILNLEGPAVVLPFPVAASRVRESIKRCMVDDEYSLSSIPVDIDMNILLTIRGVLAYDVLYSTLRKRWSVNYGVNKKGTRRIAVPFKAKDTATELTEFGHVDVAIILTQVSYYNRGLSDNQLDEIFQGFNTVPDADQLYSDWISKSDTQTLDSMKTLKGVNLLDLNQKKRVFNFLKKNMYCIDYYLSQFVYEEELKQFEYKISTNAWNLCSDENSRYPTTGFSGTNETQLLLPAMIKQSDLKNVLGTNGRLLSILTSKENNVYHHLTDQQDCEAILKKIIHDMDTNIILDVGAIIVGYSNEEISRTWIELTDFEAAVYFEEDNLVVMTRDYRTLPLVLSPYKNRLQRCLIYIDEIHTRGTDLYFGTNIRACVTLGKSLTYDRMVQASMRLRQLGEGQYVGFFASSEAHTELLEISKNPNSLTVIFWTMMNSISGVCNGLLYWSKQGIDYLHNKYATDRTYAQHDYIDLQKAYGQSRQQENIATMTKEILKSRSFIGDIPSMIVERLTKFIPKVNRFAIYTDEEQQKELEQEIEEERIQYRPGEAVPITPKFHRALKEFVLNGTFSSDSGCWKSLDESFNRVSNRDIYLDGWSGNIYITKEFYRTTEIIMYESYDDRLRNPRWILYNHHDQISVLLSPFEANCVMPYFKEDNQCEGVSFRLFIPRLRADQDHILLNTPQLTIPMDMPEMSIGLVSELFLFSGSLNFLNHEEQTATANFLGLCPLPRSRTEETLFQEEQILSNGFVPPKYRHILPKLGLCSFDKNPSKMIIKIIELRGYYIGLENSHIGNILMKGRRIVFSTEKEEKQTSPRKQNIPSIGFYPNLVKKQTKQIGKNQTKQIGKKQLQKNKNENKTGENAPNPWFTNSNALRQGIQRQTVKKNPRKNPQKAKKDKRYPNNQTQRNRNDIKLVTKNTTNRKNNQDGEWKQQKKTKQRAPPQSTQNNRIQRDDATTKKVPLGYVKNIPIQPQVKQVKRKKTVNNNTTNRKNNQGGEWKQQKKTKQRAPPQSTQNNRIQRDDATTKKVPLGYVKDIPPIQPQVKRKQTVTNNTMNRNNQDGEWKQQKKTKRSNTELM